MPATISPPSFDNGTPLALEMLPMATQTLICRLSKMFCLASSMDKHDVHHCMWRVSPHPDHPFVILHVTVIGYYTAPCSSSSNPKDDMKTFRSHNPKLQTLAKPLPDIDLHCSKDIGRLIYVNGTMGLHHWV
jgi:hypothetical protein